MATPSTETDFAALAARIVVNAPNIASLPESLRVDLARLHNLSVEDWSRWIADPERIARQLNAASPGCLVALEALLESGGQINLSELRALLIARLAWNDHHVADALDEAISRGLIVRAMMRTRRTEERYVIALAEQRESLASRVIGVSLPPVPKSLESESETPSTNSLRERLARTAACVHFTVKTTRGGHRVNRTSLRKLGTALGMSDDDLAIHLELAIDYGLVRAPREILEPDVAGLRAVAAQARGWISGTHEALLRAWVGMDRWLPEEALVRALAFERRKKSRWPVWVDSGEIDKVGVPEFGAARALVRETHFRRVVHEGETFVQGLPTEGTGGDGHVTPAFEVMLGPEANLDLIVLIALAAQPVRFDRVLTFKLTPASLAAAAGIGLDVHTILDALARVGRHAVPSNVVSMVEEWMRGARSARIRPALMVELSNVETADAAARALGTSVIARPTSTLLLVDASVGDPAGILAVVGIRTRDSVGATPTTNAPIADAASLSASALWPAHGASQEKVQQAKRLGFPLPEKPDDQHASAPIDTPWDVLRARAATVRSERERLFLEIAAQRIKPVGPPLAAWFDKLAPGEANAPLLFTLAPLALLAFASLPVKERARLLRTQTTLRKLVAVSNSIATMATVEASAAPLWRMLTDSALAALMRADLETLRDDKPDTALGATKLKPTLTQLPGQDPRIVRADIERAIAQTQALWMHVSSKSQGDRVVLFQPERIAVRGSETLVLGTDLDAVEGRSFPLTSVKSVRVRG